MQGIRTIIHGGTTTQTLTQRRNFKNTGQKSNTGTSHQGFGHSNHFRESFQLLAVSEVIIFIIGHNGLLKLDQS